MTTKICENFCYQQLLVVFLVLGALMIATPVLADEPFIHVIHGEYSAVMGQGKCVIPESKYLECNGKQTCAPIAVGGGEPCLNPNAVGQAKTAFLAYRCDWTDKTIRSNYRTATANEGEKLELNCSGVDAIPNDKNTIDVIEATYAAATEQCDPKGWIQNNCQARRSCSFRINNGICGDPHGGIQKRLDVHYRCLPRSFTSPPAKMSDRFGDPNYFNPPKNKNYPEHPPVSAMEGFSATLTCD